MSDESPPSVHERCFVLPDDVLFIPVEELIGSVRDALNASEGEIAVTRPGFRAPSRLVDSSTAALLKEFRPASRIVDAILRFSVERELDPERTLDEAFPALLLFTSSRILVPEDSPYATGVRVSWAPGQVVAGLEIQAVLQCTHDTEVYRACTPEGRAVALKIEQEDAPTETAEALSREEALLRLMGGAPAPELVQAGQDRGRRFLAISWVDGVAITARASKIRNGAARGWRGRLHGLACNLVRCYADLHAKGICHGDVHPRNALVDDRDRVTLIDFGVGRKPSAPAPLDHPRRTGFGWYLDPEAAACLARSRQPDPIDAVSEQYALAALLYEVFTGAHYLEFASDYDRAYEQILGDAPLPFTRRGFEGWTAVESVLSRALSKKPEERYPSTEAFCEAIASAQPPRPDDILDAFEADSRAFVDALLHEIRVDGASLRTLFDAAPVASSDLGASGLAWFLYRVALLRHEPGLLAHADIWARRAEEVSPDDDAFHTPASTSDDFKIGACSVLHRASGIHYVRALICHARGDTAGLDEQLDRFMVACEYGDEVNDVTLGRGGVLLAAATLLEALASATRLSAETLASFTRHVYDDIAALVESREPTGLLPLQPYSFAHGWVGVVYAQMRGARAMRVPLPDPFKDHVDRLARLVCSLRTIAQPPAHGLESEQDDGEWTPGWCNGTAGYIPLFLLAHEVYGDGEYARVADWAASNTHSHANRNGHLCCGLAGRVFALLHMYRYTGRPRWLQQARALARHLKTAGLPTDTVDRPLSLFWGRLGCALALEELQHPEWATMPVFGDMGWSTS